MLRASLIGLCCLVACKATSPEVDDPGLDGFDAGGVFADTIVAFGDDSNQTACTEVLPLCSEAPAMCGPQEVLGAPDATFYALPPNGRLEVAFRCAQITEKGAMEDDEITPEFEIVSTVEEGSQAIVEVSLDGTDYVTLRELTSTVNTFDLSRSAVPVVRFVRISDTGSGGISIDAVSAL